MHRVSHWFVPTLLVHLIFIAISDRRVNSHCVRPLLPQIRLSNLTSYLHRVRARRLLCVAPGMAACWDFCLSSDVAGAESTSLPGNP